MKFPKRVYTEDEVKTAKTLIEKGWKHRLRIKGSDEFIRKVNESLALTKTAKQYDFLRTYIQRIIEIEGFSQLREAEIAIWANNELVSDPVDAASFFVQKAHQMKEFLEGRPYYGGQAEARSVGKRLEFLETLKNRTRNRSVKRRCEEILKKWAESSLL
jgi:hypothetical protein